MNATQPSLALKCLLAPPDNFKWRHQIDVHYSLYSITENLLFKFCHIALSPFGLFSFAHQAAYRYFHTDLCHDKIVLQNFRDLIVSVLQGIALPSCSNQIFLSIILQVIVYKKGHDSEIYPLNILQRQMYFPTSIWDLPSLSIGRSGISNGHPICSTFIFISGPVMWIKNNMIL